MFIIYVIDLSKTEIHFFTKIKNTDNWKKKKMYFSVISFQEFLIFHIQAFSEKAGAFL